MTQPPHSRWLKSSGGKEYRDSRTSSLKSGFRMLCIHSSIHLRGKGLSRTAYDVPCHVTDKTEDSKPARSPALWASQSSGKERHNEGCIMCCLKQGMRASFLHT